MNRNQLDAASENCREVILLLDAQNLGGLGAAMSEQLSKLLNLLNLLENTPVSERNTGEESITLEECKSQINRIAGCYYDLATNPNVTDERSLCVSFVEILNEGDTIQKENSTTNKNKLTNDQQWSNQLGAVIAEYYGYDVMETELTKAAENPAYFRKPG